MTKRKCTIDYFIVDGSLKVWSDDFEMQHIVS